MKKTNSKMTFKAVVLAALAAFACIGAKPAELAPVVSRLCAQYGIDSREGEFDGSGDSIFDKKIRAALKSLEADGLVEHVYESGTRNIWGHWRVI